MIIIILEIWLTSKIASAMNILSTVNLKGIFKKAFNKHPYHPTTPLNERH